MGLRAMRDLDPGTSARTCDRQAIPTTGLFAQELVAEYADHLPLYRQESIFACAGLALPRSTRGQWVGVCGVRLQPLVDALRDERLLYGVQHADETPVQMLDPGKQKTHSVSVGLLHDPF